VKLRSEVADWSVGFVSVAAGKARATQLLRYALVRKRRYV
jgi:hypothetical protein